MSYFSLTAPAGVPDAYAARFTAAATAPTADTYTFRWFNDGAYSFKVDGTEHAFRRSDQDGDMSYNLVDVSLTAGLHTFVFEMIDNQGTTAITFQLPSSLVGGPSSLPIGSQPNAPATIGLGCAADKWETQYWDNTSHSGLSAEQRCTSDPISYNWGTGNPSSTRATDFSTQFSKYVSFPGGIAEATFDADDEFEMWIDNRLVASSTGGHYSVDGQTHFYVGAGSHRVTVRHADLYGGASLSLTLIP